MSISRFSRSLPSQLAYGDPIVTDHATLIPVSRVTARTTIAVGMFVVRDSGASWVPVVDADRIARIGVATGFVAATLGCLAVLRKPPWPDVRVRISKTVTRSAD